MGDDEHGDNGETSGSDDGDQPEDVDGGGNGTSPAEDVGIDLAEHVESNGDGTDTGGSDADQESEVAPSPVAETTGDAAETDGETSETPTSRSSGLVDAVADLVANVQRVFERDAPADARAWEGEWHTLDEAIAHHPTRRAILADVKTHFAETPSPDYTDTPTDEAIERRLFDFSYLAENDEVERYWVNRPYAYVSVLEHSETGEHHYRVTEPTLDEYEEYVLSELTKLLRNSLMYHDVETDEQRAEKFTEQAGKLIREHTAAIDPISVYKLLYYLRRDFVNYDRIDPIMRDGNVEDISCDGTDVPVFVYHTEYRDLDTNVSFDRGSLTSFVTRMAQRAGKHLSVSNPLVDASLPDGSRIQLTFGGDVATRGPNFTIRQFSSVPDTPVDLVNWGTFSVEQMAYLWLAIENNRSLVFAGGTGSGKTTSLNAVSFFIPKKSKVVSIEDTREISLPHDNWIQSLTRESATASGQGEVTMYQQLQTALRQRPEYILVGEIRTESKVALTFFQAMATGHTAYTTVHSESVTGVINRLENEPLGVPTQMLKELDIVSIQRQVMLGDERVRRNDEMTELLTRGEADELAVNDVFEWDAETDSYNETFESEVLKDIAADRGWDRSRLNREFERRVEVLEYLVEHDVTWYEDVARTIHTFIEDQDRVLDQIRSEELQPTELEV